MSLGEVSTRGAQRSGAAEYSVAAFFSYKAYRHPTRTPNCSAHMWAITISAEDKVLRLYSLSNHMGAPYSVQLWWPSHFPHSLN